MQYLQEFENNTDSQFAQFVLPPRNSLSCSKLFIAVSMMFFSLILSPFHYTVNLQINQSIIDLIAFYHIFSVLSSTIFEQLLPSFRKYLDKNKLDTSLRKILKMMCPTFLFMICRGHSRMPRGRFVNRPYETLENQGIIYSSPRWQQQQPRSYLPWGCYLRRSDPSSLCSRCFGRASEREAFPKSLII